MDRELQQTNSATGSTPVVPLFRPQPGPQLAALQADWCFELLFGGARGGGKSIWLLMDFLKDVPKYKQHWHGMIVRKTYPELEQIIQDSWAMFPQTGAEYEKNPKTWHWPNGASLKFRNLETLEDVATYQGFSMPWLGIDEAGNYKDSAIYYMLLAIVRSGKAKIPTTRIRLTANPGGPGHHWLKQRFVDPAPKGYTPIQDKKTGRMRMYIPSRLQDNKILMEADPNYIENLKMQANPELVRAWLEGDWTVQLGSFFPDFSITDHVIAPFNIPSWWYRFRSLDWGHAEPFSCLWFAVSDGTGVTLSDGKQFYPPKGSLIVYREWYGCGDRPNTGIRLSNEEIAHGIKLRTGNEPIGFTTTDSLPFQNRGGPTIAEIMARSGVPLKHGNTDRITGWAQVHSRLKGGSNGPLLYITSDCIHTIRTFPILEHDKHKFEDVADGFEDHAIDCVRYACMERPVVRKENIPSPMKTFDNMTYNDLLAYDKLYRDDED